MPQICSQLLFRCLELGSTDNMTAVLLLLGNSSAGKGGAQTQLVVGNGQWIPPI